jgi:hypothetical protein
MLEFLQDFNKNYASAIQALTPFVIGLVSWIYYKIYTESKLKEGDAASYVKPVFWSLGKKYKIFAVHKYEKTDEDQAGYIHKSQNMRSDQWKKLILIKSSFLGLRHEIIPKDKDLILTVIISRNGKEKWKLIDFNK